MNSDIKQHGIVTRKQNVEIDTIMSTLSSKMANIYEERESATLSDYIEYTLYLICKRFGEK